jgi:hypothetical protein
MTFRLLFLCVPLAVFLTACAGEPLPPQRFPEIRFIEEPPIRLDVESIQVVDTFQPSFKPPEIEYEFPVPPQRALAALATDRFLPTAPGSGRLARFTIEDATVRESELPRKEGVEGAFTIEQAERYDGSVAVLLEIIDPNGLAIRTAAAKAVSSRSVAEDITPDERDQVWYEMSRELARSLDRELERQIDASFYPYRR